jgi:hypothetical protein
MGEMIKNSFVNKFFLSFPKGLAIISHGRSQADSNKIFLENLKDYY